MTALAIESATTGGQGPGASFAGSAVPRPAAPGTFTQGER
jgi:hypothetical protein